VPSSIPPSSTPSPSPRPTVLAFPSQGELAMAPGRYDSSPPFVIEFTFRLPDEGWHSAHLHGEFFDVMRFDGPDPRVPTRWIAWAHPDTIHGATSEPAEGLSPHEAATVISTRPGLDAGPVAPFDFAGLEGVQLDLHADAPNTHIFGGSDGNFGLEPGQDARLGIVAPEGDLLLVLCLAAPAELDAACAEVQPILESVEL
jgi:hypothetical protein